MRGRSLQHRLDQALTRFPVVGLIGPRQVGKTTLARSLSVGESTKRPPIYIDLERPSDLAKLSDPELYLTQHSDRLVMIDEVQRRPDLFPVIRSLVDDTPDQSGRFLLLGSAAPDLLRDASESLAGRIRYLELAPFRLEELSPEEPINRLWIRGGYPRSFLAASDEASDDWRQGFVRTYLEQDLAGFLPLTSSVTLRRFWTMVAHLSGQLWNASKLGQSLGLSAPTVRRYFDFLEATFIARQLPPYFVNTKKRLVKTPKVYLRDTGLLHTLLGLPDEESVLGSPVAGASWEGFVLEQVASQLPASASLSFYRSSGGAELDLVVSFPRSPPLGIEIKRTLSPSVSRGMRNSIQDLGIERAFVIYPGGERYPLGQGIEALPLVELTSALLSA